MICFFLSILLVDILAIDFDVVIELFVWLTVVSQSQTHNTILQ